MRPARRLRWVDLSFNSLTTIDEVITSFPTLCTLYLHANAIKHLSELDKLSKLEHLKSLTLHGNPIESDNQTPASKERYRNKIISMLPRMATQRPTLVPLTPPLMLPLVVCVCVLRALTLWVALP